MRFKHIMIFFWSALPLCMLLRTLQLIFTVEGRTGFIKQQYSAMGNFMTVVICAAVAAVAACASTVNRGTCTIQNVRPGVAFASFAVAVTTIYEISSSIGVNSFINTLYVATGFVCAVFFMAYGIKGIYSYKLPAVTFIIPVIHFITKLVCTFINISSIALITENIFIVFTQCAVLIFMLEFAKLANNIGEGKNYKKLLGSGVAAIMLCAVSSVPPLVAAAIESNLVIHQAVHSIISTGFMGVYIFTVVMSHFGDGSILYEKHSGSHLAEVNDN